MVKKIEKKWLSNFHISHVVKLRNLEDFIETLKMNHFSEDFLIRCIVIFSCCVFSIAAENRSISNNLTKNDVNITKSPYLTRKNSNKKYIEKYI